MAAPDALRVICGPTAAGKSHIAMALAERSPLLIISADSRQIYRQFDVGTAKPTLEERSRVPHRGIDVVDPEQRYSAAAWAALARHAMQDAIDAGRIPVVVGGTGFYIRALTQPLFREPELDTARRTRLQVWLDGCSTDMLRRWCEVLDPPRASLGRTQLLRAIEVALLAGRRLSALQVEGAADTPCPARYLVVDAGAGLRTRIVERVDQMLRGGWLEEVRRLAAAVPADAPAWLATGYAHLREVVLGRTPLQEARERIIIATRQYAKRQRTWFRHQLGGATVTVLDSTSPDVIERAREWWR